MKKYQVTPNVKAIFQSEGIAYEEIMNDETIDITTRHTIGAVHARNQISIWLGAIKMRNQDQLDKLKSMKTEMRIVELKNFDQIPLEENNK